MKYEAPVEEWYTSFAARNLEVSMRKSKAVCSVHKVMPVCCSAAHRKGVFRKIVSPWIRGWSHVVQLLHLPHREISNFASRNAPDVGRPGSIDQRKSRRTFYALAFHLRLLPSISYLSCMSRQQRVCIGAMLLWASTQANVNASKLSVRCGSATRAAQR